MTTVNPPDPSLSYGRARTPKGIKRPRPDDDDLVDARLFTKAVDIEVALGRSKRDALAGAMKYEARTMSAAQPEIVDEKTIEALEEKIDGMVDEKIDAKMKSHGDQIIATLNELSNKIDDLSTDVSSIKCDVDGLKSDVSNIKTDVDTLKTDVDTLKTDVDTLKTDVGNIKTDVDTLKTDVGNIKTDVDTLKTDVGNIKTDVDTLKTDVGDIKRDVGDLSKKVDDSSRRLENLTTKVDGLSRELTVVARGHVAHVKNTNRISSIRHLMEVPFPDDTLPWGQRVLVPGYRNDIYVYLPLLDSVEAFSQLSLRHAKTYYAGYYPEGEVARRDLATLKDAIWKAIGRDDKLPVQA